MRNLLVRAAGMTCLSGLMIVAGCSPSGPAFAPVNGRLTSQGKPVAEVQVEFWPDVTGPRSIGMTDADGRYSLTSDDGEHEGAVVGSHKVVLVDLIAYGKVPITKPRDIEKINLKSARIGPQFSNPNQTKLKKEVASGKENTIDLEVTGP